LSAMFPEGFSVGLEMITSS